MRRFLTLSTLLVALLIAFPVGGADDDLEKDVKTLSVALGETESNGQSLQLLKDFLEKYPDTKYTASALNALAYYQAESMGDRDGAVKYIKSHIAGLKDEDHIRGSKVVLAGLYGEPEYKDDLRAVVKDLENIGGLSFRDYSTLINTSFGAEDWELARDLLDPAKKTATPEAIQEEYPDASGEKVKERSESRALDLGVYEGWAMANTGERTKAIELFEAADENTDRNYFDTPEGMLNVYWGKTLLMNGDDKAGLEKLLPAALWAQSESAADAVKEIFLKGGGGTEDFEDYLYEKRLERAKLIDGFSAADYGGSMRRSGDLMGKVTLVAFWFPT